MKTTKVRCCNRHEENVKLVWTFAFNGYEYWCPYCGANYGMLGAGEIRELTFSEMREMVKYRTIGKDYIDAIDSFNCDELKFNGKWIKPEDLPEEENERLQLIIDNWVYPVELSENCR